MSEFKQDLLVIPQEFIDNFLDEMRSECRIMNSINVAKNEADFDNAGRKNATDCNRNADSGSFNNSAFDTGGFSMREPLSPSFTTTSHLSRYNNGVPPIPASINGFGVSDPLYHIKNFDVFGAAVKQAILNIQSPGELCLASALAVACIPAQKLCSIRSPLGMEVPLVINQTCIAGSGTRKTQSEKQFSKGALKFQDMFNETIDEFNLSIGDFMSEWKKERARLESNANLLKAEAQKNEGDKLKEEEAKQARSLLQAHMRRKPRKLKHIVIVHEHFTLPGMLKSLATVWPVAALLTSEGAKFLKSIDTENFTFLNRFWDAVNFVVTNATLGSLKLQDVRFTTSVMIQPEVLEKIYGKRGVELRDSGYFARSLVFSPQNNIGYRPVMSGGRRMDKINAFESRIIEMMCDVLESLLDPDFVPTVFELEQEAEYLWFEYANLIECEMRPGGYYEDATDHGSKLAEIVLRVAGVLHAFEFGKGEVSVETMKAAIHICWLSSMSFMSVFVPPPQEVQDTASMKEYIRKNHIVRLQGRDIMSIMFGERFIPLTRLRQCGPLNSSERMKQSVRGIRAEGLAEVVEEVLPNGRGGTKYIDLMPEYSWSGGAPNGNPIRRVLHF